MTDDADLPHLTLVENLLWIVTLPTGMPQYDFMFEDFFACRHPIYQEGRVRAVARMGAASDYPQRFELLTGAGIDLVHTPSQYALTSHLPLWYPLIHDLTPPGRWFDTRPSVGDVESSFTWPVFVKGERQTSRHQRSLSIVEGPEQFERVMDLWQADPILHWQQIVVRQFVPLRLVGVQSPATLPRTFEFRSFWWKRRCVGFGPYWVGEHYTCTAEERSAAVAVAGEAARRLDVTFLVVDVAQTVNGEWIVIEVNDGQDSGYAGVHPLFMWRAVLDELSD
jgi:hypothetical protein